ncbi:MAG: IS630 family transposase, partial [Deltaproteobacteria bacterium]|nr:IS630 family transposase [Deltaproteobacteria bacterium]
TIRRYENIYLADGHKEYLKDNYIAYWGKLDSFQLAKLVEELTTNLYHTASEAADWIEKEFGVKYNHKGLVKLLHRLGFVYKKTKLIPSKADAEKQQEFVEKFNELKDNLKDNEVIYFGDAVHPQHNTKPACGWIPKGEDKEIKSNTGRKRVNINGVLNPETKEIIVIESKTINAQSTIELYKIIEEMNKDKDKIYVIIDNATYYKNAALKEYLKDSKIEQIFLPPYSPNLNLIERLWKFMKKEVINNEYYEKYSVFKQKILEFFDNIASYKKINSQRTLRLCGELKVMYLLEPMSSYFVDRKVNENLTER